ncbi:MAG: hypothetical protein AB1758_11910 [Candidatus Eremiobacterota bacterium]
MHEDPGIVQRALEAGALGYVLKTATPDRLAEAVRCAARGQAYLQPELTSPRAGPAPSLSLADLELLQSTGSAGGGDSRAIEPFCSHLREPGPLRLPQAGGDPGRALEERMLLDDDHRGR